MSQDRAPVSARIMVAATVIGAIHALLLLGFIILVSAALAHLKHDFDNVGMRLPYATEVALQITLLAENNLWATAAAAMIVLAVDVAIFVSLASQRRTRLPAVLWVVAVTLALVATPTFAWIALNMQYAQLARGLAK